MNPPRIAAVQATLPPHYASQEDLIAAFRDYWSGQHFNIDRLADLHRSVQVGGRYLARPLADYPGLDTFAKRNDAWLAAAVDIGERACLGALAQAGLTPRDIDHIFFVTTTGIATPSIEARLANRLGFRRDIKRSPLFGLGCAGGAAGLARTADYLRGAPEKNALLLSIELCSLTLQREDLSVSNIIASGLFGDGAAAAVLSSASAGPQIIDTRCVFYPDTERALGWDIVDSGFKIVLSSKVPALVQGSLGADMASFLAPHRLKTSDIAHWLIHPGGPKVLDAFAQALALPEGALARSWHSLKEAGNLSSAAVLFILSDLLAAKTAKPGDYGVLAAMGPGFSTELVLLQW
jgi:alkylresorcinol/alkylpyrone synthase